MNLSSRDFEAAYMALYRSGELQAAASTGARFRRVAALTAVPLADPLRLRESQFRQNLRTSFATPG